jgi:hypothetical protein
VDQTSALKVHLVKQEYLEMKVLLGMMIQFQKVVEVNLKIHLIPHVKTDADFSQLAVSGNVVASCFEIGVKTWAADHDAHDPYHALFHYVCHVHVLSHCVLSHYATLLDQYAKKQTDLPSRKKYNQLDRIIFITAKIQ